MVSIGISDALSRWLDGQKLDGLSIYGVPSVWINRAAKLMTFLSGLTIVLDLVGPERLRQFGERLAIQPRTPFKRAAVGLMLTSFFLTVVLLSAIIFRATTLSFPQSFGQLVEQLFPALALAILALIMYVFLRPRLLVALGHFIENPRSERATRWSAVIVFAVGFLGDLVTS